MYTEHDLPTRESTPEKRLRRLDDDEVAYQQAKAEKFMQSEKAVQDYFQKFPSFEFFPRRDLKTENFSAKALEIKNSYQELRKAADILLENSGLELSDLADLDDDKLEAISVYLDKVYGKGVFGTDLAARLLSLQSAEEEMSGRLAVMEEGRVARITADREALTQRVDEGKKESEGQDGDDETETFEAEKKKVA